VRALTRRHLFALSLLLLFTAVMLPRGARIASAQAESAAEAPKRAAVEFVPGTVIVRFSDEAQAAKASRTSLALRTQGHAFEARIESLGAAGEIVEGLRLARVPAEETLHAVEALRARADVLYAEPDFVRRIERAPNDPRYSALWGLKNTSSPGFDIGAEAAWDVTTGSRDVVVGVVDEGIYVNHEDLRDNIWHNPGEIAGNGIDDDGDGYVDDVNGYDFYHNDGSVYDGPATNPDGSEVDAHGTHVAGTIGASGDNGIGVVGVNWQSSIMSLKFIGPDGGRTSDLLRALAYAKMMRERGVNLRVLNNSYGGGGRSQAEEDAIRALGDAGILFVAAAGNASSDNDRFPSYPASYNTPNMISVAGSASFQSTFNATNYGARSVHLYAPAQGILSTTPNNTYSTYSGTSMASPHVAGVAALVLSAQPALSMERLRAAVLYSGNVFAPFNAATITQRQVNAAKALQNAAEQDTTPPAAPRNLGFNTPGGQTSDPLQKTLSLIAPGDDDNTGTAAIYEVRYSDSDLSDPAHFEQATRLPAPLPQSAGTTQLQTVHLPFRHTSGFIGVRAIDNAGNAGAISEMSVSFPVETADPYVVSETAAESLSTGGQPLNLRTDDGWTSITLPFHFTYFNTTYATVSVSTNGELSFDSPSGSDSLNLADYLAARPRIAGLWDDLRTDRRAGDDVYVVTDEDRVIFRWQAVTYNTPLGGAATRGEQPVSFEIELRRDGAITTRYGDGNQNVFPVVGISGGEPDPYLIASHTSDISTGVLANLGRASTITYARRVPTPPPVADLRALISYAPAPVSTGQQVILNLTATNGSQTDASERTTLVVSLPPGLAFVSCGSSQQGPTCAGTPGASGNVTFNIGRFAPNGFFSGIVVAQVNAAPATPLNATATITGRWDDPVPANNLASVSIDVIDSAPFGGVRTVSAGTGGGNGTHSLAIKTDGTVWAWGLNSQGQFGNGSSSSSTSPVQVSNFSGVAAIAAGADHTLALKTDGTVWGSGSDYYGQLGDNGTFGDTHNTPVQANGLAGVVAITTGGYHNLALKADGTVWAWGYNSWYASIGGVNSDIRVPTQVQGITGVVAVAAGEAHSLALKSDGTVWAWGSNQLGQAGPAAPVGNPVAAPVQVSGLTDVAAIACGKVTSYALKRDGTVWSWGWGPNGERGDGTTQASGTTPRAVLNLSNVVAIDGGAVFALALKSDGTLWAWGNNSGGALGDGTFTSRTQPVRVTGLEGVTNFSAGGGYGLAVLSDGSVRAWGGNGNGQLGDASNLTRNTPVAPISVVTAPAPVFSMAGGSYSAPIDVTITSPVPGAIIRYSLGFDPDITSPVLNGSTLHLAGFTTLKARVWKDGMSPSPVTSATYTFAQSTPVPTVRFAALSYRVNESDGSVTLTAQRMGDTSATSIATIATSADGLGRRCDERTTAAFIQCDFVVTNDTITFAPGETQKTIKILIANDSHPESDENFTVFLVPRSNAVNDFSGGAQIIVTIADDGDAAGAPNPLDTTDFFVREQYLDFLSREPEQGQPWSGVINNCAPNDPSCDRVSVSSNFFRSQEFYLKGYFVFRFYLATLGRMPTYGEIVADMRSVTASTSEELTQKRDAFARDWLTRQEFRNAYDRLSNAAFVYALCQQAGVATVGGASRDSLVADLQAGRRTRADVVRLLVESPEVDAREYNSAFVAMQYYGYLRRTPEPGGYADWLRTINANPSDIRSMVSGFVNSQEYRLRFGKP
jgi:alpha-tubulin suppressor-like RCC1 family protein/subtilisin family serine protease